MCCSRLNALSLDVKAVSINVVFLDEPVSKLLYGDTFLICALDHLIVDIGEVLDESNVIPSVFQISCKRVKSNERSCVA